MRTPHRRLVFLGLVMFIGFSTFALAAGRTPDVVGKVVNSSNATVEGSTLLSNRTIFSGEAVDVGEGGSVLLSYSPTGRAVLEASTHVRFNGGKGECRGAASFGNSGRREGEKGRFRGKNSHL